MSDRIVACNTVYKTPFFSLVAKTMEGTGGEPYYSISTPDYVTVIPLTTNGEIVLVRQYRPAVESECLELPSGHVDPGEEPIQAARRELLEETGYACDDLLEAGCAKPDIGRLGNRIWVFVARDVEEVPNTAPEAGLDRLVLPMPDFHAKLRCGEFDHALHLAALTMAHVRGLIPGLLADR